MRKAGEKSGGVGGSWGIRRCTSFCGENAYKRSRRKILLVVMRRIVGRRKLSKISVI